MSRPTSGLSELPKPIWVQGEDAVMFGQRQQDTGSSHRVSA